MRYIKRYNKFSFQTNCRICLTQSVTKMIPLDAPLKGDNMLHKPQVYEAIELVMSEKVNLNKQYPSALCAVCFELLKISYELKIQYCQSQKKLKMQLGETSDSKGESKSSKALVEIRVGSESFNIHDVFIVEEDSDNDQIYDGFLNNLGKSVTASLVKKGYQKPKPVLEVPSVIIEKLGQDSKAINDEDKDNPESEEEMAEKAMDNADDVQSEKQNAVTSTPQDTDDGMFIDTPVSEEIVKKFVTSTENDKEALQSAMGLKYKCPYCQKPMSSLRKVKLHTSRNCKKNNSNSRCYVCGVTFEFRKQLLTHLKQVHLVGLPKTDESKEVDKHKCNVCDKVLQSNGSLFYHMSKHLGRRYGCDLCDKRFYTRSQAANHRQTHNREDTLVVCPICGKGFHYQSGLFYHMKMHTNERNYQCSFCPRRFYARNSLKRHELTHTGGRPYACNYCDKKFRSLGEVKKHKLLHTGERPYHCKYCDIGFTQTSNLKVHLMTHPGKFQCMHCSKGFAEKDILRFHLTYKHGVGKEAQTTDDYRTGDEDIEYVDEEMVNIDENIEDVDEEIENTEQDEKDLDGVEEPAETILEEEYFITEEYIDDEGQPIVQTYAVKDTEVLVETVEEDLQ